MKFGIFFDEDLHALTRRAGFRRVDLRRGLLSDPDARAAFDVNGTFQIVAAKQTGRAVHENHMSER
jgi:hypothetical protein